jgi:hypothetical protein
MPKGSALSNGGEILMKIGKRITPEELQAMGTTTKDRAQTVKKLYQDNFDIICSQQSTVELLKDTVYDRYRYKGAEIERNAKHMLSRILKAHKQVEGLNNRQDFCVIDNVGQGELSLVLALMHPRQTIYSVMNNPDAQLILQGCSRDFVHNIRLITSSDLSDLDTSTTNILAVLAEKEDNDELPSNTIVINSY